MKLKLALLAILTFTSQVAMGAECVILLHGLARTASSMGVLESSLQEEQFEVVNLGYPSRKHSIDALANMAIKPALTQCKEKTSDAIHFVTHSLGGILVRQYLANNDIDRLGRVVMLAPPNQGSEVVDALGRTPGFRWLNGPAGLQLGTRLPGSVPKSLGAVDFDLGVIAGTRSINRVLSLYLPNPDDGKVSVASTKVDGMDDHLTVPHSHPFLMRKRGVISQVIHYLRQGRFQRDGV